jgi:hypothetical protein
MTILVRRGEGATMTHILRALWDRLLLTMQAQGIGVQQGEGA